MTYTTRTGGRQARDRRLMWQRIREVVAVRRAAARADAGTTAAAGAEIRAAGVAEAAPGTPNGAGVRDRRTDQ